MAYRKKRGSRSFRKRRNYGAKKPRSVYSKRVGRRYGG